MTDYVSQKLQITHQDAHELRDHYWKIYGATLKGLIENHGVNPKEFLLNTHNAKELSKFVKQSHALENTLKKIKGFWHSHDQMQIHTRSVDPLAAHSV